MTVEACQSFCKGKNYPLAGVEFGTQCYCGLNLASGSSVGKTGCTMACGGNSAQTCGGSSRLNVYNNTLYEPSSIVPSVAPYDLKGCFIDSSTARGLSSFVYTSATNMTVEICVGKCSGKGYSFAGVEYGAECYCGNTLASTSTPAPLSDCNMFCNGNTKEFCGSSKRMLVYSSVH
jgi:hypothetical protein